jgi:hypothetical protein
MTTDVQGLLAFIYGHETGLNPIVGAPANIEYAYGEETIRDKPLITDLEDKISGAVAAVYGEGYKARVYSGGQEGDQRTGSVRHDHGKAADVHIFAPDGRQLMGDELAPLGQFWAASKYGGVGMEMKGGGIHLDAWETPPPGGGMSWDYVAEGGQYTPAQRAAIEAGLRGEMPVLKGEAKPAGGRGINPAVYNTVSNFVPSHLRPSKPLTEMTVQEVLDWQDQIDGQVQSEAAGAVQVMPDTLRGLIEAGKVDPTALFDGTTQDAIAVSLLEGRGLKEWQAGELTTEEFGNALAMEWASLPVLGTVYNNGKAVSRGGGYYGGDGLNPSLAFTGPEALETVLADPGSFHVSLSAKDGAPWEPGIGIQRTGIAEGQMAQYDLRPGPSGPDYAWRGSVDLAVSRRNQLALPGGGRAEIPDLPQLPQADYATRTGAGGGGDLNTGAMRALADEWTDGYFVRATQNWWAQRNQDYDMSFDPIAEAVRDGSYSQDEILFLGDAMNAADYARLKSQIDGDRARNYRREVYNGWAAPLIGGLLNPDSLVSMLVPGGVVVSGMRRSGINAIRSAAAGALLSGTSELALETGRASLNSQKDGMGSLINVGMATALGGLFSAAVAGAVTPAARRTLANKMATELAHARGIGKTSVEVDIGKGQKATVAFDNGDFVTAAVPGNVPRARTFKVMDVNGQPVLAVVSPEDLRRGVWRIGDRIMVSARAIAERVKAKDMPEGVTNANELMEYELGRVGAFARKMRDFLGKEDGSVRVPGAGPDEPNPFVKIAADGRIEVDRKRLERIHKDGGTVKLGDGVPGGRVTPIEVNASAFATVEDMEAAILAAHDLGSRARDDVEFRQSVEGLFGSAGQRLDDMEPPEVKEARARAAFEAELEAAEHLETWRKANNKILQDARVEAFARIMDSPYKRIHRNALSSWARDMVDMLAGDGGFLRGVDGAGETLGPSVYSRAKTWQGMVDRLYRKERELYAKYLGLEQNPGVLGINLSDFKRKRLDGSKAIPMRDWRRMVSRVHITGVSSGIAEVDAMATHLKGVLDEYAMVADSYGVISGMQTMQRRAKRLEEMIGNTNDATKRAGMEAELARVQKMMAQHANEPGEDYFTRVWSRKAIAENREAFLEKIVKPWMRQQNEIERWEPGKDDIKPVLDQLRASKAPQDRIDAMQKRFDNAPEKGEWRWIKASTAPADIDKRAREMVEDILGEAEPDVAAAHRDPQRPTFGRHRQFNIPNRMLLADGPEGNGIADFIETDYLLVQRVYADRMGPAIEMARTFGRPGDGVSGIDGFDQAMERLRESERAAFEVEHGKSFAAQIEAARQAEYDAELARIKGAPERLEKATEELKAKTRDYARAREEGELARMTDDEAEEWLEKAPERAKRLYRGKMAAEGKEVIPAAERAYVKKAVKTAEETFSRIRLEGGGDTAMRRMDEAKRLMDMARAKRNGELRMANMSEKSAEAEAELARGFVDPLDVIEKAGGPRFADHFAPIERDMLHLRDRVANRVIRNPDRWDNRAATVLKDWSRLVFMGLSGLNALQETGALIMRHGAAKSFRAAFMNVDADMGAAMKAGIEEMRKAGAILDVAMGGALASFAETGMDATFATAPERWIRAASNRYFNWNLLAPITARFKELDAMIRVNDTLEKIDRVAMGVASKEDLSDLSRFGISAATAKRIAKQPILQNEGGFWLANTDAWGDEDLIRTFRAAIAQGNENTILMATAADKPTIIDGTAYIRRGGAADKYAKRLGLRQVGDYWQVQSGLMSLPFSFWNYGIAATNKILISGIDEPSGQKLSGIAAMMGIGYMIAQIRTDENQWQGMSMTDRIAKAVDQSGVVGLVGTYANLFQGASLATMGVNPLPFERTRGMRRPGLVDMAEQFAGAGPSAIANLIRGVTQGDLEQARWGLPLANYVGTGWLWEALIDGGERRRAGLDG